MPRTPAIAGVLATGAFTALFAAAHDRVASIAESTISATDRASPHQMLVELVHAMDRATHSSTKIVLRPFARSLKETAAGLADFHLPLIQDDGVPPPPGLAYVMDVDFGQTAFVVYSRKQAPLDARTVAAAARVETEPGHEPFFQFPVSVTHCVPCSLDKILLDRIDALVVPTTLVDRLVSEPKYKGIHRALYKTLPIRALVPANVDSTATRRYLIEGVNALKKTGELWEIMHNRIPYSDWQP